MNRHPDDVDEFPTNIHLEAHREMVQVFGSEKPDHEWILTDYDVWERNPFFTGVRTNGHPEDEHTEDCD